MIFCPNTRIGLARGRLPVILCMPLHAVLLALVPALSSIGCGGGLVACYGFHFADAGAAPRRKEETMSLRPRALATALASLPFYVMSSLMPARAAAGHTGLPGRAALVQQAFEDLAPPTGGPFIYVSAAGNDANSGLGH